MLRFGKRLQDAFGYWRSHNPTRLASSLAYYGLFSLVPILVIIFGVAHFLLRSESVGAALLAYTALFFGSDAASFIQGTLANFLVDNTSFVGSITWIFVLIILANHAVTQLNQILDEFSPAQEVSAKRYVSWGYRFLISFFAILLFGTIILGVTVLTQSLSSALPDNMLVQIAAYGAAPALVFIFIFLGTVIAFSVLPQARIPTSALLSGAGLTALLLTIGNAAVSLYFTYGTSISAYGVAGSLVALLLWFYYSALIFLFGVSYTWILVKERTTFSA